MALENIIDRILKDVDAKTEALKKEAASKRSDILKRAEGEALALGKRILDEAHEKAEYEKEKAYIAKNLEIRKEILKKKRMLIDKAFNGAMEYFKALDDKKYLNIIEKIIAANVHDKDPQEIQFSKNDASRVKKDFIDHLNKKGLNLKMGHYLKKEDFGFIIKKDKFIMDFTFSKGLDALKEKLQFEVSKILFEQ